MNVASTKQASALAALLWISLLQYVVITFIVAAAWPRRYSFTENYISSLGNTSCGLYEGLYVCSPLSTLMNASFIVQGIALFAGAILFYKLYNKYLLAKVGFLLLALGGLGGIVVGAVPENVNLDMHSLGALMPLLFGNIGILLVGISNATSGIIKQLTIISGVVSVLAFLLFSSGVYLGLAQGGMERIADSIQVLWIILFGVHVLVKPQAI